ncbi:hypothetical protein HOA55_02285 [archaeon]|jgi:hypothetical protein|nr:hypothetical protein [archaeon]MBT3577611.1 hypothetical protein [archaeon]MBT6820159.1 hypothetical protein [archaeon]MBT6956136.1 hypothetical protein [archaeon]MBT7025683.1 hypothetical protein [archaeon]
MSVESEFIKEYRVLYVPNETTEQHRDRFRAFAKKHFVPADAATLARRKAFDERCNRAGFGYVNTIGKSPEEIEEIMQTLESDEVQTLLGSLH